MTLVYRALKVKGGCLLTGLHAIESLIRAFGFITLCDDRRKSSGQLVALSLVIDSLDLVPRTGSKLHCAST